MLEQQVLSKDGQVRKINDFRKRINYDKSLLLKDKVQEGDIIRVDLAALRLYGSPLDYGFIIDSNDSDVFSFDVGDELRYVNPGVR
jgi:hypothetical protein